MDNIYMNDLEFESVIDGDDSAMPAIYTSEDERVHSPLPNTLHLDSNTTLVRSKPIDNLRVLSGLVSYTTDDNDDDDNDEEESDAQPEDVDDADDIAAAAAAIGEANHHQGEGAMDDLDDMVVEDESDLVGNQSTFAYVGTNAIPPTILSSEHYELSKQLTSDPSYSVNSDVNLNANDGLTVTERLIKEIQLPAEPTGHCRMELQEKVENAVRRMRLDISYDPNRAIQDNKAFRNPSIYEKLISFLNIKEKGTNFPPEIYNPYRWTPQSFYDDLARVQNLEIDRLTKMQKEQKKAAEATAANNKLQTSQKAAATAEVPTSASSVFMGYSEPKKPSKWDTGAPTITETDTKIPTSQSVDGLSNQITRPAIIPVVGSLVKRK